MDAARFQTCATRFLAELQRSPQTIRAYRADLNHLQMWLATHEQVLDAQTLGQYLAAHPTWAAATRSRKHTSFERFARWAIKHELLDRDPTVLLERPRLPPPHPKGLRRAEIERIFAAIPTSQRRDALLFRLVYETGLRIGEALGLCLTDLDLIPGDAQHLTLHEKWRPERSAT